MEQTNDKNSLVGFFFLIQGKVQLKWHVQLLILFTILLISYVFAHLLFHHSIRVRTFW